MRAQRPIFNSSIATELGYLPLESTTAQVSTYSVTANKATIAVAAGVPALTLGAISVTPDKGTVVTRVGVPTLTLGAITITPDGAVVVVRAGVPILSGIPIDVYPDAASIVVTAGEPLLTYFPVEIRGGHGDKPTFTFVRPKPPTQLEKEIKAMVDVYRTEAALRAGENAAERQRLQTLEMGRKQRDFNTQLNRQPKERREAPQQPLIDGVKLQKMIERAQKQTQDEINLANKVKMAKVRAAKRKTKVKR